MNSGRGGGEQNRDAAQTATTRLCVLAEPSGEPPDGPSGDDRREDPGNGGRPACSGGGHGKARPLQSQVPMTQVGGRTPPPITLIGECRPPTYTHPKHRGWCGCKPMSPP